MPETPRTLDLYSGVVIPVIDQGDQRTVGIMSKANHPGLDAAVLLMTPHDARDIAADLIRYAWPES